MFPAHRAHVALYDLCTNALPQREGMRGNLYVRHIVGPGMMVAAKGVHFPSVGKVTADSLQFKWCGIIKQRVAHKPRWL